MRALDSVEALLAETRGRQLPVGSWNPPLSGDIDIRIARDGNWFHEGEPIRRETLVRLFAQLLRREGGDYFLVTPVEKWRITVDDLPFVAIDCEIAGDGATREVLFHTSVGDVVACGPANPLVVDGETPSGANIPRVHVRDGLDARISRNAYYRLVECAELREDGSLVLRAGGGEFLLGNAG